MFYFGGNIKDPVETKADTANPQKLSRLSVDWGKWSREMMNLVLRNRINGDTEELKLQTVSVYWAFMSQLLEMWHKGAAYHKLNARAGKRGNDCKWRI
jgi:hypothetical protein